MDVDQGTELSTANFTEESTDDKVSYPATVVICGMLRQLLSLPDYSLTRIAALIGKSTATVRRLLQGSTQNPSVRTFDKIVRLYCAECHRFHTEQSNSNLSTTNNLES